MGNAKAPPPGPEKARPVLPVSHDRMVSDSVNAFDMTPRPPIHAAASSVALPAIPSVHTPRILSDDARDSFLARVRKEVFSASEEELEGTGWSAEGCPYLEYWLGYYQQRSVGQIEAALRHYARGGQASDANDYLALVTSRVRLAIRHWKTTGEIDSPEILTTPAALESRFPDAEPLASAVRTQMESAFGGGLGDVRIATADDGLARIGETSARAVAIGKTVAFASGAYQPATTHGQLLLAHELAHTLQQERGSMRSNAERADEHQADQIAAAAVARSHGIPAAMPAIGARTGLSLRRCNNFDAKAAEDKAAAEAKTSGDALATPTKATTTQKPAATLDPSVVRKPKDDDMFLVVSGNQMVALPSKNLVYDIVVKPNEIVPQLIFGVGTVGKDALRLVNIGGREAVLQDSGGMKFNDTKALLPEALRTIVTALGVKDLVGIVTLHIHEDHIRNFEQFIVDNKIEATNLRFPKAFEDAGKEFTAIIARLRTTKDPRLLKLGYGRGAATPFTIFEHTSSGVFESFQLGDKLFEDYGISAAFDQLGQPGKKPDPLVDRASVIEKITDLESGTSIVTIGDPRGAAMTELRNQIGEVRFRKIFEHVRVLSGFQHHTGALNPGPDVPGLELLLAEILTQNPSLTIIEQSSIRPYGKSPQFLNASLIEALRQFGISHDTALDPTPGDPKSVGAITVDRDSNVQHTGRSISASVGDPALAARLQRFDDLGVTVRVLTENSQILSTPTGAPIKDQIVALEATRVELGQRLGLLPQASGARDGMLQTLLAGVGTGVAKTRPVLTNQPAVDALRQQVLTKIPGESVYEEPGFADFISFLANEGELFRSAHAGLEVMRRTGVVSDEVIRDLILLDPELAKRLLEGANVTEDYRVKIDAEMKEANTAAPTGRVVPRTASVMIALTAWNEIIGPAWGLHRMNEETTFHKYLNVISWWQDRGVTPLMDAADNYWFDYDTHKSEPAVIKAMLDQHKIDYITLTKIEGDENWDAFNIWMATHVRNFEDYTTYVRDKPYAWCPAVRPRSYNTSFQEAKWEYFAGDLSAGWIYGYSIEEQWLTDPRLDLIMQAMAARVVANTTTELGDAWKNRAALDVHNTSAGAGAPGSVAQSRPMLSGRAPQRHVRFKSGVKREVRQIVAQSRAQGHLPTPVPWTADPTFYVLDPKDAVPNDAKSFDSSYLVVVGADYATYEALTLVQRQVHEVDEGRLVQVKKAGNPSGQVLVDADAVEDIP